MLCICRAQPFSLRGPDGQIARQASKGVVCGFIPVAGYCFEAAV